jgi:hypothetical protein
MKMAKKSKKQEVVKTETPEDGAAAYRGGFMAADCPFPEGTEEFDVWNEEWDNAAELAQAESKSEEAGVEVDEDAAEDGGEEGDEGAEKSVVKAEYRARYAEAGHPAHCGDELAILINNLCLAKAGFDIPRFEAICEANGVDLNKYNRTTNGWQGRLRMTGRNVLAGKVFAAGGVVKTPVEGAEAEYRMSEEWMANRRKPRPSLAYGQGA